MSGDPFCSIHGISPCSCHTHSVGVVVPAPGVDLRPLKLTEIAKLAEALPVDPEADRIATEAMTRTKRPLKCSGCEVASARILSLEEQLRGAAYERMDLVKYVLMEVARAQVELHDGDTKTLATRLEALHGWASRFLGTREAGP